MSKVTKPQSTEAPPERDWYQESARTGGTMDRYSAPLPETTTTAEPEKPRKRRAAKKRAR